MLVHIPTLRDSIYRKNVLSLLTLCDMEFQPSLSSKRLIHDHSASQLDKLTVYLSEKDPFHHYLLYIQNHSVLGMMNFVPTDKKIEIDTFCLHPSVRHEGISYHFYSYLFAYICPFFDNFIVSLECNKNSTIHLHILDKLHFQIISKTNDFITLEKDLSDRISKWYF